ncbi:DDE-type integrase/transposase/recombinase, partial [Psychrobacter pacificensis]
MTILGIDIGTSMPSLRVIRYLDQLAEWHGYPKQIRVDNGSEFTSRVFTDWASAHGI